MFTLDSLIPDRLPYPIKGGIIRGIRTGIAFVLAGVAVSIGDGSLVKELSFIPADYIPFVTLGLTITFTGVDKWLREKGLVDQAAEDNANLPLATNTSDTSGAVPSVVDVPDPVVNVSDDVVEEVSNAIDNPMTDDAGADVPINGNDGDVNPTVFDDPRDDTV